MKTFLFLTTAGLLALAPAVFGQDSIPVQTPGTATSQVMGRGRGGAPFAWNDRNRDGICDITGRPVGEGRPIGFGRGRGGGGGFAWGDRDGDGICDFTGRPVGWGRGVAARGGGRGRCFAAWGRGGGWGWGRGYPAAPAPVQPPPQATPSQPNK
jgi:hypothetical protein